MNTADGTETTTPMHGAQDGQPVVVVLFAGTSPDGDAGLLAQALRKRGAWVLEVDILIGGRFHDLVDMTPDAIGWHLLRAANRSEIQALHAAVPCETFSIARDEEDMVRRGTTDACMGIPGLPASKADQVFKSNALILFTLDLAYEVAARGGEVTIENPVPRMDPSLPHVYWKEKSQHANLFRIPPVLEYKRVTNSVEITTPLCAHGADSQKYVMVLATRGAALSLAPVSGLVCEHSAHKEHAYGTRSDGRPGALMSGKYPYVFCVCLASALLKMPPPEVDATGKSPVVVPAARAEISGPETVFHLPPLVLGSLGVPVAPSYDAPNRSVATTFSATAVHGVGAEREAMVRAPDYEEAGGPGWWDDVDEGDLSDEGDDVFSINTAGVTHAYRSCVKVEATALKASVRTRFSVGPDGSTLRHDIPKNYDEAAVHEESELIWEAMIREINSHVDCKTWVLRPAAECFDSGKEPIDCMWVYDCKVNMTSSKFLLWKARLVARGDQMIYLRDYNATYSGVVRHSTWRMFLAMCALVGLFITGADVSTAYLHAPLRDFVVWMKQPKGFEDTFEGQPALCRLQMAIYGLKQSAREWAITVITWLSEWGFRQCTSDRYLFVYKSDKGTLVLLIWVEDIFCLWDIAQKHSEMNL